jgi:hypothetical protein
LIICSFIDGFFGFGDNAAMNIGIAISLLGPGINTTELILRNRMAGSYGNYTWTVWRKPHTVFQSDCHY